MNRDQILELAKAESAKVVDYDLLGNPITDADVLLMSAYGPLIIRIANAAIQQYKDSLLKDVGEPVAYMTTDEEGSASMLFFDRAEALKYSGDDEPVNLFAESQLQAAQEEWNQCSGLLDDSLRSIEMLEDQLATAEQRVAEACADLASRWGESHGCGVTVNASNASRKMAKAIRNGEWRKYMKEV